MSDLVTGISIVTINGAGSPVIVTVDLAAPTAISCVDVTDALLSGAPLSDVLKLQHSADNLAWTDFGVATLGGGKRSRRFAAPPYDMVSRRYWRLIINDLAGANGRSLSIASVRFLAETADLSNARVASHFAGDEASYTHVLSDLSADIYSAGVRVGAAMTPWTSGVLANIDYTHDADLLLVFHASVQPHRLFRQGADDEWDSRPQDFENVPLYEFDDTTYTNGTNEIQQITFDTFANADTFNITFDGETTSTIIYSSTMATTAARIKAAIEALDAMGGGTVTVTNTSGTIFSVTFQGKAGQSDWAEIAADVVLSANGIVTTATLTEGKPGGEAVASASRGWWCSGDFDQDRLILAAPKSARKIINASQVGDYFNLLAPGRRATDGVMVSVTAGNIRQISAESFLQVFTEAQALSLRQAALLGDNDNPIKPDGDHGIQDRMRPVSIDGATVIVQNGGRAVTELRWSEEAGKHLGENVSVRAPELVIQPLDIFSRRAGFGFECDALFVPIASGGMAVYQSQRASKFRPWARYATPGGRFLAGAAEERGPSYVVVEREINGELVRYVEGFDINRLLDSSIMVTLGAPASTLPCAHLEGCEKVWAIGSDGNWWGPYTVEGGVITADGGFPAATYEVGMFFDAHFEPMPIHFDTVSGDSIRDNPKQVARVTVSVLNSAPPELVYMGKVRAFPARKFASSVFDAPPMLNLVTDRLTIDRLRGWSADPEVRIRRKWPGPFYLRSTTLTVLWTT